MSVIDKKSEADENLDAMYKDNHTDLMSSRSLTSSIIREKRYTNNASTII